MSSRWIQSSFNMTMTGTQPGKREGDATIPLCACFYLKSGKDYKTSTNCFWLPPPAPFLKT